jgi:hypothetical protein
MSCLFDSLQHFLPIGTNETRQAICDYLEQNRQIIDGIETSVILRMDRPNYIAQMRQSSTWGGAIEIQAACNIWNMTVHVYDIRNISAQMQSVSHRYAPPHLVGVNHLGLAFSPLLTRRERLRYRRLYFDTTQRDNLVTASAEVNVPIVFNPVCSEANRIIKLNWSGGHYTPHNN